jgi:hypothetical protein
MPGHQGVAAVPRRTKKKADSIPGLMHPGSTSSACACAISLEKLAFSGIAGQNFIKRFVGIRREKQEVTSCSVASCPFLLSFLGS